MGDHEKKIGGDQEEMGLESVAAGPPYSKNKNKKIVAMMAVLRLRSVLTAMGKARWQVALPSGQGRSVSGTQRRGHSLVSATFFGYRRGHMHFALQAGDPKSSPTLLVELTTSTDELVREMASGLIRIALQCNKKAENEGEMTTLLDEPLWTAYCNGRKCGFAMRRECGYADWKVLKAVEPISMGAGVLPGSGGAEGDQLMYMRARFERVTGSRDSEAFYMINPEPGPGVIPDLSIYLVRI